MQRWPARHTAAPLSGGFRAHRIQRLSQAAQNRHCTLAPQRTVDTHEIKLDHYSRKHHRFSTISPPLHHAERHFLTKVFPQNLLGILFKQFKWFRRDETSCGSPAPLGLGRRSAAWRKAANKSCRESKPAGGEETRARFSPFQAQLESCPPQQRSEVVVVQRHEPQRGRLHRARRERNFRFCGTRDLKSRQDWPE